MLGGTYIIACVKFENLLQGTEEISDVKIFCTVFLEILGPYMLFGKCRLSFTAIHTLYDINFLFESQTIRDHIGRRKKEVKLERFLIPHDLYVTFSYSINQ